MQNEKTSELVNFFVDYYNYKNGTDFYKERRKYYSSNKSKDYINYILTGIEDMKNMDYVEYMQNKEKSYGIFNAEGLITDELKKELRKTLRTTKSVIWDGLITFEEEFGKTWCDSFEQAYELVKSELPKFFKRAGLNPDNIEWFAGLHENTDNRHIHICFFEKQPLRIRPQKKGKHFSIGKLPLPAILEFKANLELSATDYKAKIRLNRHLVEDYTKEQIKHNSGHIFNNKLINLAKRFPDGNLFYNSASMVKLRPEIDSITDYLINNSRDCKIAFLDFRDLARLKDEKFANYCKRNKCKQPYTFEKKYIQDIYRRIGNIIIKSAIEINNKDKQRRQLNAKIKAEKYKQKKSLFNQILECAELSQKVNCEIIQSFQDYMDKLDNAKFSNLVELDEQAEM